MPEQITEEVWADWVYPVTVVTRTCSLRGSAVLSVDGRSMPQAFSRSVQAQDTVHASHGAVGLSADPLEFGREDTAMLGALHEEVAHSLVSVASEQRTRLYAAMPHSGELDARVAVLLLDPSAGDSLWLASSWGLDPSDL